MLVQRRNLFWPLPLRKTKDDVHESVKAEEGRIKTTKLISMSYNEGKFFLRNGRSCNGVEEDALRRASHINY